MLCLQLQFPPLLPCLLVVGTIVVLPSTWINETRHPNPLPAIWGHSIWKIGRCTLPVRRNDPWESATLFSLVFGGLCYFGSQRFVSAVNGLLVLGIITSFTALVVAPSGELHLEALLKGNFEAVPSSIPIVALSFVYHDCNCSRNSYSSASVSCLEWCNQRYITYLGPDVEKIIDPLQQLLSSNGPVIEAFSLLPIGTLYLGFILGLSDFLADLLKLPTGQSRPLLYLPTLLPPLVLALLDHEIFFKALDFAGTYGVLVLFGVLPAAMSCSDRCSTSPGFPKVPHLVPGGKLAISLIIGGATWVILSEILNTLSHT